MQSILDTAHSLFLENYKQNPDGSLVISVVEGIRTQNKQAVTIADKYIGDFFSVEVKESSRVAQIKFNSVEILLTYNESYDSGDKNLEFDDTSFIRKVTQSTFREFANQTCFYFESEGGKFDEYVVFTEDQVFQIFSKDAPFIEWLDCPPNMDIERTKMWTTQ